MKKILFFLILLVSQLTMAENAEAILDKASARFKAAGEVKIGFQLTTGGNTTTGYINLAEKKFFCDMGGFSVWFDGTTMWHYVKATEEVNVSTPSARNVERMNPYFFLSMYKNGYTCKMGKSTKTYYEVIMSGNSKTAFTSVTVRLSRKDYSPLYTKTVTKKTTMEINVNSFLPDQKFEASIFRFNPKEFPQVEVIDLR